MKLVQYVNERPQQPQFRVGEVKVRARLLLEALMWLEGDDYAGGVAHGLLVERGKHTCRRLMASMWPDMDKQERWEDAQ